MIVCYFVCVLWYVCFFIYDGGDMKYIVGYKGFCVGFYFILWSCDIFIFFLCVCVVLLIVCFCNYFFKLFCLVVEFLGFLLKKKNGWIEKMNIVV